MISALKALEQLRAGNRRFVAGDSEQTALASQTRHSELLIGHEPIAIILGCSDARVPAEIIFDQGVGDLFVIRVAGNIVAPSQIGSVEFAADRFGTGLVVVLGHTQCGVVQVTIEDLKGRGGDELPSLRPMVARIRPAVEHLFDMEPPLGREEMIARAVRANITASADHLRHGSEVVEQRIAEDGLLVVGAEYSLETGAVHFFDGLPAGA